jgi:hypothetical protein
LPWTFVEIGDAALVSGRRVEVDRYPHAEDHHEQDRRRRDGPTGNSAALVGDALHLQLEGEHPLLLLDPDAGLGFGLDLDCPLPLLALAPLRLLFQASLFGASLLLLVAASLLLGFAPLPLCGFGQTLLFLEPALALVLLGLLALVLQAHQSLEGDDDRVLVPGCVSLGHRLLLSPRRAGVVGGCSLPLLVNTGRPQAKICGIS